MKKYTVHQAKSQLSKLIKQALNGEEVVILNRDKPLVKLTAVEQPDRRVLFGMFKGQIAVTKDFKEIPEDFKDYL